MQEELDAGQLWDAVIYHPRLDDLKIQQTNIPDVGQFILFALEQKPRIGKVMSIDSETLKPISVHLWKPNKFCASLDQARFRPSMSESGPDLMIINPSQVRLAALALTSEGYLTTESQKRVRKTLRIKGGTKKVKSKPVPARNKHISIQRKRTTKVSKSKSAMPRSKSRYQLRPRD